MYLNELQYSVRTLNPSGASSLPKENLNLCDCSMNLNYADVATCRSYLDCHFFSEVSQCTCN